MPETTTLSNHVVAVYSSHDEAEGAVKMLSRSGFDMTNLSIVGQNYATDEQPVGFVNAGERMVTWGKYGAFWGSIWGLLFGSGMLFIPGVGPIMFAGWIVSALAGAVLGGGAAALGGALASIGVPHDSVVRYHSDLAAGRFLLLAHGDAAQVKRAEEILGTSSAASVESYSTNEGSVKPKAALL